MIVFATLFVCGGGYTPSHVARWCKQFETQPTAMIVVGLCDPLAEWHGRQPTVFRVNDSRPSVGNSHKRYAHLHNKNKVWKLPYDRVAFYDLDVIVKPPVTRCAELCKSAFCAVRDPVATWPRKVKTYFNSGFFVATPSVVEYAALRKRSADGRVFADQDVLNDHFAGRWEKLPKQCNWLSYEENHPGAITDPTVYAVHARLKWNPHSLSGK